ncbi:hypothetical protein SteCoe_22926 [Stentor coeruleus]|uniref:RING-type domain-containing protein n=1 Tax=Stentor coeruleus TaxID=5963 RepID=A0A1R2BL09_9CILI|nr:hypothetical protein SteCoe_22926 [Stentor coeruleus]
MGNICRHQSNTQPSRPRRKISVSEIPIIEQEKISILNEYLLYDIGEKSNYISFKDYHTTHSPLIIETLFTIQKDSLKFFQDPITHMYCLSFFYDSKCEIDITLYFFVKEYIEVATSQKYFYIDNERTPSPITLHAYPGNSVYTKIMAMLDLSLFSESELKFANKIMIPLVVFMRNETFSLLLYMKLEGTNVIKVREIFDNMEDTYEILDVFLTDNDVCSVCLNNPKTMMLFPCRHVCLCESCLNFMMNRNHKCPICRSAIRFGYKIYKDMNC